MGWKYICRDCGTDKYDDIIYVGRKATGIDDSYHEYQCVKCGSYNIREEYIPHPAERRRAAVYATGNRWAIENWNATH